MTQSMRTRTFRVGMDVHQSSRRGGTIAVLDADGRLCSELIIETRVDQIREFFNRLSGNKYVIPRSGRRNDGGVAL